MRGRTAAQGEIEGGQRSAIAVWEREGKVEELAVRRHANVILA